MYYLYSVLYICGYRIINIIVNQTRQSDRNAETNLRSLVLAPFLDMLFANMWSSLSECITLPAHEEPSPWLRIS
jgi:hypothetical protein